MAGAGAGGAEPPDVTVVVVEPPGVGEPEGT
ncbi:Uncharacterised protein [Mycobacteroides abscessus subsp. abscessus]|nr:Uncharacterised protein [Mycobacteroides abscessus subsp. abscessus]